MPIRVKEDPDSRQMSNFDTLTFKYTVTGTNTIDLVADAVVNYSEPNYGTGWSRQWSKVSINPDTNGGGVWKVEVPYGVADYPVLVPSTGDGFGGFGDAGGSGNTPPGATPVTTPDQLSEDDPLGREWKLDFSQQSRIRTKSIKTFGGKQAIYPGGIREIVTVGGDVGSAPYVLGVGTAPKGACIGYNPSTGDVAGVQVPDGTMRLELTLKIPHITLAYTKLIKKLQNHVNSEAFLTRPVGEVMFVGASESGKAAGSVLMTYTFEFRDNHVNEEIEDDITLSYRGWDALDILWLPHPVLGVNPPTKEMKLDQVTVEQIHPYADLNPLFQL